MLISSIAASVSLRKSLSLISLSPRASRWALTAIRRYLATVTPGIATGYWNAMNRPARARSSGSASVTSAPRRRISPSVTSSEGWPMIAFARVDLPDPFGPISAWTSPFETSRSSPFRIRLSSALTCRFLISRSAMCLRCRSGGAGRLRDLTRHRFADRVVLGELDQVGQGGPGQRLGDPAMDAGPEKLGSARAVSVRFVRAEHPTLALLMESLHGRDRSLEGLHDLEHLDLRGRPCEPIAAMGAANGGHHTGFAQLRDQVLEVGQGEDLRLGDGAERDRLAGLARVGLRPATQLDHQPDAVLGFRREEHLATNPTGQVG